MYRLDKSRLSDCKTPAKAETNCLDLAPWLVADGAGRLPSRLGGCAPLFVWRNSPPPALAPGFLLPVEWAKGDGVDPYLPEALKQVAITTCEMTKISGWFLRRGHELQRLDLADFPVEDAASAFVPLALGLILAAAGLLPRPDRAATGAWTPGQGITAVLGIEFKAAAAKRAGARTLFVPTTGDMPDVDGLEVQGLPTGVPDVRRALSQALQDMAIEPTADDPLHQRYAFADLHGREMKNRYLIKSQACRDQATLAGERSVRRLAVLVSNAGAVTTALSTRATDVRLIHSERDQKLADLCTQALTSAGTKVESVTVNPSDDVTLSKVIRTFVCGPEDALDATGGTTRMSLVAAEAAQLAGAAVCVRDGANDGQHLSGSDHLVWLKPR